MTEPHWELLDRYLAGQSEPAERERIERWLAEAPRRRLMADCLRLAVAPAFEPSAAPDREAAWARLELELRVGRPSEGFSLLTRRRWPVALRVAAAVLLVGSGALVVWAERHRADGSQAAPVAVRTLTTPRGQRAAFKLPDGSSVVLGPASTLRHAADFGREGRELSLEGEAYFEVRHDERRPFVVRAGDVVAQDLGTEFVIRVYPEDAHARVVVRQGTVALHAAGAPQQAGPRVLGPGDLGRLSVNGELIVERADTAAYFAWTEGRLTFDGVPLREALPQLGRWFDLDFRLGDSTLGDVPLTATFKNQQTDEVLDLLAASLEMRQVKHGRVVTLYPGSRIR
jgi:ferric-dicitrate binding protein FerR (iron transport regulator)